MTPPGEPGGRGSPAAPAASLPGSLPVGAAPVPATPQVVRPGRPPAAPAGWRRALAAPGALAGRHALALLLAAAALAWLRGPVSAVVARSLQYGDYEHYSHIVLIPVASLALLVLDRDRVFARLGAAPAWGVPWLAVGVLVGLLTGGPGVAGSASLTGSLAGSGGLLGTVAGFGADPELAQSGQMLALVLLWTGAFLLSYGPAAARAAWFPLAFLLWAVPLPPVLLAGVIGFLQWLSAEASYALFTALGVPIYREGFVFALPGLTIEVAAECSGIRSFLALVITSLLAGRLVLRRGWTWGLLLLALVPLAVVKNAIRIVVLSLLAIHVDPSFITGSALHRYGGMPLFAVTLLVLAGLLWLLARAEGREGARPRAATARAGPGA